MKFPHFLLSCALVNAALFLKDPISLAMDDIGTQTIQNSGQVFDISEFVKIGTKPGGSVPGVKYRHKTSGKEYIIKYTQVPVSYNEFLAGKLYKAAGIKVPNYILVTSGNEVLLGVEFINGLKPLSAQAQASREDILDGFLIDAWLGDYDVVGSAFDNIMDYNGQSLRVDIGASLKYRAQGSSKGAGFNGKVDDVNFLLGTCNQACYQSLILTIHEIHDPLSKRAGQVFGNIKESNINAGVALLKSVTDGQIQTIVMAFGGPNKQQNFQLAQLLVERKAKILNYWVPLLKERFSPAPTHGTVNPVLVKKQPPVMTTTTIGASTLPQDLKVIMVGNTKINLTASQQEIINILGHTNPSFNGQSLGDRPIIEANNMVLAKNAALKIHQGNFSLTKEELQSFLIWVGAFLKTFNQPNEWISFNLRENGNVYFRRSNNTLNGFQVAPLPTSHLVSAFNIWVSKKAIMGTPEREVILGKNLKVKVKDVDRNLLLTLPTEKENMASGRFSVGSRSFPMAHEALKKISSGNLNLSDSELSGFLLCVAAQLRLESNFAGMTHPVCSENLAISCDLAQKIMGEINTDILWGSFEKLLQEARKH